MLSSGVSHHERYSQHHTDRVTFPTLNDTRNGPPCAIAQQHEQSPTSHLGADTSPEACELAGGDRRVADAIVRSRGAAKPKALVRLSGGVLGLNRWLVAEAIGRHAPETTEAVVPGLPGKLGAGRCR